MTKGKPYTALSQLVDTDRVELRTVGWVERTDLNELRAVGWDEQTDSA